jgi:hypothetical protein
MNTAYAIIITSIVILIICYCDEIETFVSQAHVCNQEDGHCYKVVGKYGNVGEASRILAHLNKFGVKLLRHLRNKYIFNKDIAAQPRNYGRVELVKFLIENYNPDNIIENAPTSDVNTSYVDDKGKVFAICLREKVTGFHNFHKMEELEFVVLHEMSHMATTSFGHENDFWANFKFLLQEAEMAGIHTPVNYERYPMVYCSLKVDYSPYFDESLPAI